MISLGTLLLLGLVVVLIYRPRADPVKPTPRPVDAAIERDLDKAAAEEQEAILEAERENKRYEEFLAAKKREQEWRALTPEQKEVTLTGRKNSFVAGLDKAVLEKDPPAALKEFSVQAKLNLAQFELFVSQGQFELAKGTLDDLTTQFELLFKEDSAKPPNKK